MKILMIVDWKVDEVGSDDKARQSANVVITGVPYWFFKYWPVKNLDVCVVGRHRNGILDFIEKKILRFSVSTAIHFFSMHKYDLVICFHSKSGIILSLLRWVFRVKTPPFVLFDVEGLGRKQNPVLTPLLRKVADNLSLVYYFSSVQKEDYEKYLPNMLNKIKFLRWGVDFTKYIPANCVLEDTILMIGYQGSGFRDWKTLIEAWRKVSTKKDTVLVIVGKHSLTPQEAGTNDLPKNIRFAGVVDLAGLNSLTQRSRFIVLPLPERRHAYAQMTLLGCMAIGKAVIVSKVSGVIDCVEDMATAVLHELANPEDLAEKMLMLLSDPALADSIGKKAMDCVRKNYTEEIMAKDIYESVTDLFGAGIRF